MARVRRVRIPVKVQIKRTIQVRSVVRSRLIGAPHYLGYHQPAACVNCQIVTEQLDDNGLCPECASEG